MSIEKGTEFSQAKMRRLWNSINPMYSVFKTGSTWYAEANFAGGTDYNSDTSLSTVVNNAFGALTAGRTWKEKVLIKGDVGDLDATLTPASYTILEVQGRIRLEDSAGFHAVTIGDGGTTAYTNIDVIGGDWDGNRANQAGLYHGIYLDKSVTNMRLLNAHFTGWYGKTFYASGDATHKCEQNSVIGNIMEDFEPAVDADGVDADYADHFVVANNQIEGSGDDSIDLGACVNFSVTGNVIDTGTNGIEIYASKGTVAGNSVYYCTNYGIYIDNCDNVAVNGNFVGYNNQSGIVLAGSQYCPVTGNTLWRNSMNNNDTYDEIRLFEKSSIAATFNTIIGNTIQCDHGTYKAKYGINEESASCDNNTFKNNTISGPVTALMRLQGANNSFDREPKNSTALDLSGAGTDVEVYFAKRAGCLCGYTIFYTEASSADAGVNIRVGRYQDGVALDDDYWDVVTSEVSKSLGYSKHYATGDLTQTAITAGDTITVGTAGSKTGTGEVIVVLDIAETS